MESPNCWGSWLHTLENQSSLLRYLPPIKYYFFIRRCTLSCYLVYWCLGFIPTPPKSSFKPPFFLPCLPLIQRNSYLISFPWLLMTREQGPVTTSSFSGQTRTVLNVTPTTVIVLIGDVLRCRACRKVHQNRNAILYHLFLHHCAAVTVFVYLFFF